MAREYPYVVRGNQALAWFRSKTFNIDNGSGTTDDDIIFGDLDCDALVQHVRAVYIEATDTAGATGASFQLGTAAGGATIVAATTLEASKSVGDATESTVLAANRVAAGSSLFARHTGIAATEGGQYYLQVGVLLKP